MNVKIKRLTETAKIPTRGSEYAAGYDLYADEQVEILGEETVVIGTGISMEIPEGYFGAIYARSGLATKQGLRPANCVGVVDSDYRGEVIIALHNDTDESQWVLAGSRIAQLLIQPVMRTNFNVVDELGDTERGIGGFGSTGVK